MVWPTFPGLGGLSVRRDLNIGITVFICICVYIAVSAKVALGIENWQLGIWHYGQTEQRHDFCE